MAKTNYRGYLREEVVPLKKYFYVLRPLLAARWVHKTGGAAPIEFEKLLTLLEGEPTVLAEVRKLLALKRATPELGRAAAVPVLNEFIEANANAEEQVYYADYMACGDSTGKQFLKLNDVLAIIEALEP